MRLATRKVIRSDADQAIRSFTAEQFARILRAQAFIASVAFWRDLDRLAQPDAETRFHAMLILREIAERAYEDCGGHAFSPQEAECFRYCGLTPAGVRSAGSVGKRIDTA
jgi:hypothetical protein